MAIIQVENILPDYYLLQHHMFVKLHLQMFLSGHYAGQDLVPKFRGGEPWKKVFGPVYIYLNSGSTGDDPLLLWEDAKIQVGLCVSSTFHVWMLIV